MKATTVHHHTGIEDGRFSRETLLNNLSNNDNYSAAKENICTANVLIIDEISMLSMKVFEDIEYIYRKLRSEAENMGNTFGGVQRIAVGDFRQLKPVPNPCYGDTGEYCFESMIWNSCFPHSVNLTLMLRQSDEKLKKIVNELADGTPSEDTNKLLYGLSEPLTVPPEFHLNKLFATNLEVELCNADALENITAPLKIYRAKETCKNFYHYQFFLLCYAP